MGHKEWKALRDSVKGVLMWQGEGQGVRTLVQTSHCKIPTAHKSICLFWIQSEPIVLHSDLNRLEVGHG